MSELAALTNSNPEVIPGFILSRPSLAEIGLAEVEFAKKYLELIAHGVAAMPPKIGEAMAIDAKNDVLLAKFAWGNSVFNLWAMNKTSLPFLTWLSVRVKHASVTLEQVIGWYGGAPVDKDGKIANDDAMAEATWKLWGFDTDADPKKKGVAGSINPPTGPESSTDAAPQPQPASDSPQSNSAT